MDSEKPKKDAVYKSPFALPKEYSNSSEKIEIKMISQMKSFAELLMSEKNRGSLSFLGENHIRLKDLEFVVHKLIEKLPDTRKFKKPNPNALPQPSPYAMDKYKLKECRVQLDDVEEQAETIYSKALQVYNTEKGLRIRYKQRKLLYYLKTVAEKQVAERKEAERKRNKWGDSSSSDYSDDEYDSRGKKRKVEPEDLSYLSKQQYGFKIPKKGSKKDDNASTSSTLKKAADVIDDGKYKYSYGGQKQSRPHYSQQKSFENNPAKDQSLDLLGLMSGMKNTLKKETKPQFEETEAGKKMAPGAGDPELEALLAEKVINPEGNKINVLTGFFDERSNEHIFKCFICTKQIDGKINLMTHLNGDRHKRYRQLNFKEVNAAKSHNGKDRPICRFFAETGICKRYKSECPNRHERPMTLTGENPFQATKTAATFKPGAEPKFMYKADPNQRQQGPMILSGSNPFQKVETAPTFKSGARPPH